MAEASVGKLINYKYRLLSELGHGAMGIVYRAEQLDPNGNPQRQVALKTMRREFSVDSNVSQRFLREVHVAMQLRSSHTVTVYDSGRSEEGQLYYAMELVRGPTLKDLLARQGPLPVERVIRIAGQICEALAEAHNLPQPVVHRDLKPANIFIEQRQEQDWVKIGDFGIAKVLGEQTNGLTNTGMSPGTPRYMAPEQWTGQAVEKRTDLYALGVVIYEMLAGKTPFAAEQGVQALMYAHLHTPPPPLPSSIPAGIRQQVERLLAKTPQERPTDALSVRRALEAAVAGQDQQETCVLKERTSATAGFSWRKVLPVAVVASLFLVVTLYFLLPHSEEGQSPSSSPGVMKDGPQFVSRSTPLALRLAVMKRKGNTVTVLKEGEEMASGDYYGVFFEPVQESFVYILQQDATGKIDILFPDSKVTSQTNPVPAGKAVWIPHDEKHWFYLDQSKGREVIVVAASVQQDEKLESILRSLSDKRGQGALAEWMVSPERGRGGMKKLETKARFLPEGKSLNLETALVQGSGADFVYKVVFQHR